MSIIYTFGDTCRYIVDRPASNKTTGHLARQSHPFGPSETEKL